MEDVFLKSRSLSCRSYACMSSNNLNFVSWCKWTVLRWHDTMCSRYNFCSGNNNPSAEWIVVLMPYSYSIIWITGRKKINLPRNFTSFYLSTTKNFVDGRRNCRAKRWYFMTSCIKNIIFVSKRFCDRSTCVTPWFNITIIKSDVWNRTVLGDARNNFLAWSCLNNP